MSDYITIKEAKAAKKGSFIGVVIKQGDLKSGTTKDKDWTHKNFTIQDTSDAVTLTAWGDEISMLKVGNKYEFIGFWWKEYEGKTTLAFGKYASLNLIGTDEINNTNQTTMDESPKETRGELNGLTLPKLSDGMDSWVSVETVFLLQIENEVKTTMKKYLNVMEEPNNQKVGMFVKIIYEELKSKTRDIT